MKWGIAVMSSKTSFINTGILRHDLKRYGWIGAAYLLGLLLSVPLQIVMVYSRQAIHYYPYSQILSFQSPLQVLFWLSVPVLTGIFLFRYLQSGDSADLAHALPVRRETLYNTHLTAGVLLLFVPVIITSLVSWVVLQGLGIEYVKGQEVLVWLGIALVFNLLLFTCSVAVGMISGMSTVQGALTYIMLLLPAGLTLLVWQNLQNFVFGLPFDFLSNNLEKLSPLMRISYNQPFSGAEVAVYLLCCIILYLLGRFFYRRRPSENAGNALAFRTLHPVFVWGFTFCGMLLVGTYFNQSQDSMGWTYFGYFLGSILSYILSLILVNKSLDIFRLRVARNYLLYSLVIILLIAGLYYDVTGYEKRIPPLEEVKSVYLDGSFYRLKARETVPSPYLVEADNDNYQREVTMVYRNAENLAAIHELHQAIVANRKIEKALLHNRDRSTRYRNWCLAYQLENGQTVYRQYWVPVARYAAQAKPILESQEHKKMVYDILNISPRQVDMILISAREVGRNTKITDPALILQAVGALQTDARSQTYEEMTSNCPPWSEVTLLLNEGKRLRLSWEKSYVFFEEWLRNVGEYRNARVMPEDIKYALIEKVPVTENDGKVRISVTHRDIDTEEYLRELENSDNCVRVTDPGEIEYLLRHCTHQDTDAYRVHFVLHNGSYFSSGLNESWGQSP